MLRPRSMGIFLQTGAPPASDYASTLLSAIVSLAIIAGLAYAALRFGPARLWKRGRSKSLCVEDNVALDARSSLVIVRVEGRRLLLATHAQETARLITELAPAAPAEERAP